MNTYEPLNIEEIEDYLEYECAFRDYDFVDTEPDLINPSEADLIQALRGWNTIYTGTLRIQVGVK